MNFPVYCSTGRCARVYIGATPCVCVSRVCVLRRNRSTLDPTTFCECIRVVCTSLGPQKTKQTDKRINPSDSGGGDNHRRPVCVCVCVFYAADVIRHGRWCVSLSRFWFFFPFIIIIQNTYNILPIIVENFQKVFHHFTHAQHWRPWIVTLRRRSHTALEAFHCRGV